MRLIDVHDHTIDAFSESNEAECGSGLLTAYTLLKAILLFADITIYDTSFIYRYILKEAFQLSSIFRGIGLLTTESLGKAKQKRVRNTQHKTSAKQWWVFKERWYFFSVEKMQKWFIVRQTSAPRLGVCFLCVRFEPV